MKILWDLDIQIVREELVKKLESISITEIWAQNQSVWYTRTCPQTFSIIVYMND